MRGHKRAPVRKLKPDPKYKSELVTKLINYVMKDGKKVKSMNLVYKAFDIIAKETKENPLDVFKKAVSNITPIVEVKSRRVGGANYQVPVPVNSRRGSTLALRWLVQEARKRSNKTYHTFGEKLAAEMIDALNNQGGAVQRRETSHKMAEANKAFAHFRW